MVGKSNSSIKIIGMWITTLSNLEAMYPISELMTKEYYVGATIITLSMIASLLHHISYTSKKLEIKGLYFSKYSEVFLNYDKILAFLVVLYSSYLFSLDPDISKLYLPFVGFICLMISSSILTINRISYRIKLIIFFIFHNAWHIIGFYSVTQMIP